MSFLKIQLLSLRGLITVPGVISLGIWLLAVPLLWLDHRLHTEAFALFGRQAELPYDTATAVLSTVASAAMTTLSLVYSIVLVVFTLAAGNIAPRLLRRFTGDRVNQVTAGILGGAFLLSLTILHQTTAEFVPVISVAAVMFLAVLFVLQLIFFVHSVSQSVTIDEEVVAISRQLEDRIETVVWDEEREDREPVDTGGEPHSVAAAASGYVSKIEAEGLCRLAHREDVTIRLLRRSGDFILEGQDLAAISPQCDEEKLRRLGAEVHENLLIMPSRGAVDDIEYSVNLLVEIAIRALSPGVNDTFTAIASADRMSAALLRAVRDGLDNRNMSDDDGTLRVIVPGLSLEELLNAAFHPLRQCASGNLLMLRHLADALARLHDVGNERARKLIETHGRLLLATCKESHPLAEDYALVEERLTFAKGGE